jgi:hypothetical protein
LGRVGYQKKIKKFIFEKGLNRTLFSLLVQCAPQRLVQEVYNFLAFL